MKTRKLSVETLGARAVPAAGPVTPAGISLTSTGVLNIKGGARNDTAHIWVDDGQVHVTLAHTTYVNAGGSVIPITVNDPEKVYAQAQVASIHFHGLDGNDTFTNDTFLPSMAAGHGGKDVLTGGWATDVLIGGDAADVIEGRGGDDDLRGGTGGDTYKYSLALVALGSDTIDEKPGVDTDTLDFSKFPAGVSVNLGQTSLQTVKAGNIALALTGGLGIERVLGTPGDDTIVGNARPNQLFGTGGDDLIKGGLGNDALYGGEGHDKLYPGAGTNTAADGAGNDLVDFSQNAVGVVYATGGGNDEVIGTPYADKLTGSAGNDRLDGMGGNDVLTGSPGNDELIGGTGTNTLSDGSGNDLVDFRGNAVAVEYTTGGGNDIVYGSSWNDVLTGSVGADELHGEGGNDRLFGKDGTDHLYGDGGDDWLEAGSSAEVADGGSGQDNNAHKWAINGATYDDVEQAGAGTCVFLSALAGGARQGIDLAGRITYLGNFTYNVRLYNGDDEEVYDQKVYFNGTPLMYFNTRLDPWRAQEDEYWTTLFQRAYLKMTKALDVNFKDPDYAMSAVTHRSVSTGDWDSPAFIKGMLDAGLVVTAGDADNTNRVYVSHSYTVMNVYQDGGTWKIQLRNPWGKDVNDKDIANGTKDPDRSNDDGLITLTWAGFQGYHDFDRISIS